MMKKADPPSGFFCSLMQWWKISEAHENALLFFPLHWSESLEG
jgi:hypothetical protein